MNEKLATKLSVELGMNLVPKLKPRLMIKSLACWLLVAAVSPQVLMLSNPAAQAQASTNRTEAIAVASRITDINAAMSGDRLNVTLSFASSDRPQVTYTRQGRDWIAVLNGAQLQLGNGNASYVKSNPVPGITAIEATAYETNKVRVRVTAASPETLRDLIKRQDSGNSLVFSLEMQSNSVSAANAPEAGVIKDENESSRSLTPQNSVANPASLGQPLFQPKVTITAPDGTTRVAQNNTPNSTPPSTTNPVTPQLQGRVPGIAPPFRPLRTPPVGDIATSSSKLRADIVDLGSAERVPRITLRNAPAIEVLTLIGRVAGLSVVSAGGTAPAAKDAKPDPAAAGASSVNQPVSLSIENETAQDVFNNVLRITGLEANRIGNTVFVATKLPVTLKNLTTKSYRLNQIDAKDAANFLVSLGASKATVALTTTTSVQATEVKGTATTSAVSTTVTEEVKVTSLTPVQVAYLPLKDLQVLAESRLNSVTLVGSPSQVAYAEAQLARLDARKRQVVINVRVIDIRLEKTQTFGFGFGFTDPGTGGTQTTISTTSTGTPGTLALDFNNPSKSLTPSQTLLATLNASILSNQSKILTDPSITVQEGESAAVALSDQVISKVTSTVAAGTPPLVTKTVDFKEVGLLLTVKVDRIDDNGFINLSVAPSVSAPLTPILDSDGKSLLATPTSQRSLTSGSIRLRDNQTLILSGVIRDSDRNITNKIPILGDLPIIGALFRSDTTLNARSEVVIVVTPRIIDDSQNATWGYTYQPNAETQKVLDSNQIKTP